MVGLSIRYVSVVLVAMLVAACGSSDEPPANSGGSGGGAGDDSSAGRTNVAGSSGASSAGGAANHAGASAGGASNSSGAAGESNGGDGGAPTGDVDPPALDGDGISWIWNGETHTVNKKTHNQFVGAVQRVNISASDTDDDVPPNMFTLHQMPNKVGTFDCKDYVSAIEPSFSLTWQTFDKTANPPNPSFSYAADLPCTLTITRADKGDTVGDVFEGTFAASLRFPGNGAYPAQDRVGIVGTMRLTKK